MDTFFFNLRLPPRATQETTRRTTRPGHQVLASVRILTQPPDSQTGFCFFYALNEMEAYTSALGLLTDLSVRFRALLFIQPGVFQSGVYLCSK